MKKKIFTTGLLLCSVFICLAAITGITGKWSGILKTDDGDMPVTYTLKVDSGKVSGNVLYNSATYPITEGTVKGDSIKFTVDYNGNDVPHSARVYADSIGMDVTIGANTIHTRLKRDDK